MSSSTPGLGQTLTRLADLARANVRLLTWVFTALLLVAVLASVDFGTLFQRISRLPLQVSLTVLALMLCGTFVSAIRWQIILASLGGQLSRSTALRAVLAERLINCALPSTVSGDAVRVALAINGGNSAHNSVTSVIADRLFAVGGVVAFHIFAIPTLLSMPGSGSVRTVALVIAAVSVAGLLFIVLLPNSILERLEAVSLGSLAKLVKSLKYLLLTPRFSVPVIGISLLIQGVMVLCFFTLARGLDLHISIADISALVPIVILASLIPLTVGGWGTREGAAVVLLGLAGIGYSDAVAISVCFGLIAVFTACIGGAIMLFLPCDSVVNDQA